MTLKLPAFAAIPAANVVKSPAARRVRPAASSILASLLVLLVAVLTLGHAGFARAAEGDFQPVPKLVKRITDVTATLSATDEGRIDARLKAFEERKGAQIAVLMVPTTQPEPVFDYATRVFTDWKLGRKGVDDGVLLLIAKNDRKLQILTGPGISGALTDAMSKRIISEVIAPKFRTGDFAGGIEDGVEKIIALIDGEALPPPQKRAAAHGTNYENFIMLGIFAALFVGPLLRSMLGRLVGASATGGVVGAAVWFLAGGLLFPIFAGLLVFVVVVLMGAMNFTGGRGGGWGGGLGGGGFGAGGSAGGGFSGGGGGFDGGGASGSW